MVDTFVIDQVGIAPHFFTDELAASLKENLNNLYGLKLMRYAGTGNEVIVIPDAKVRGDRIHWLDRAHDNVAENSFFELMDNFVTYLNQTCYTGITGYEFHYTFYETGSFYKKHIDQFRNNDSRKYSMIIYLNPGWLTGDGGELCIHHKTHLQHISPENGKGVFFKSSNLEHEVLCTNKPRLSITGWLKGD